MPDELEPRLTRLRKTVGEAVFSLPQPERNVLAETLDIMELLRRRVSDLERRSEESEG